MDLRRSFSYSRVPTVTFECELVFTRTLFGLICQQLHQLTNLRVDGEPTDVTTMYLFLQGIRTPANSERIRFAVL